MFLQDKLDRAMEWLREKNKKEKGIHEKDSEKFFNENMPEHYDPEAEWLEEEEEIKLEKGDILAIIISAILVFGPIILILLLILVLVMKL